MFLKLFSFKESIFFINMVNHQRYDDCNSLYTHPASQIVDTNLVRELVIIEAYCSNLYIVLCAFRLILKIILLIV